MEQRHGPSNFWIDYKVLGKAVAKANRQIKGAADLLGVSVEEIKSAITRGWLIDDIARMTDKTQLDDVPSSPEMSKAIEKIQRAEVMPLPSDAGQGGRRRAEYMRRGKVTR